MTAHAKLHLAVVEDELPRVFGDHLDVILGQVTGVEPEPRVCHFSLKTTTFYKYTYSRT